MMDHAISGKRSLAASVRNTVGRPLSVSLVVPRRIVSSKVTRRGPSAPGAVTGMISRSNAPESAAAAARACESAEYSSSSSREILQRAATSSAATPWETSPGA
ncbi:unannotated protein [freshwater metagenome]|uniref:Unannotated protein n=1 Tax=freshwater metagenome TaxID=449393 RepID=A0A6J7ITT9_9ZZZZ